MPKKLEISKGVDFDTVQEALTALGKEHSEFHGATAPDGKEITLDIWINQEEALTAALKAVRLDLETSDEVLTVIAS